MQLIMCFIRPSIFLVFLAFAHAVAPYHSPVGLLDDLRAARQSGAGTAELDHVEPESIVTYRWNGDRPDSNREPKWMHEKDLFVPLATSLFDKIRGATALRTIPNESKEIYSFPENLLSLLIKIAMEPTKNDGNKPWELGLHHAVNSLNAEMKTSLEAKDVELASKLRSLPLDVQTTILERTSIPSIKYLSKLFTELLAENPLRRDATLRRLVWQEMLLLSYFSRVDREAFRNLHLDDGFLTTIVQAHSIDVQKAGGNAWYGGMSTTPISLSDELADRVVLEKRWPLADYYQDYDRLLNEGQGELKERLDRFLFTYVMSSSGDVLKNTKTSSALVPKLTKLPTGWWLTSSQTSIDGEVRQLVKELFESIHSDYITVAAAINEKNEAGARSGSMSAVLFADTHPYTGIHGRQASILARYQAAQHLCRYSVINCGQIFSHTMQGPRAVKRWLRGLSLFWSTIDRMDGPWASHRFSHFEK